MSGKDALIRIFELYPDAWQDSKRFRALLNDLLPESKLERNLLYLSVEENIPLEMSKQDSISNIELHRWSQRLVNSCGCMESLAETIIGMWLEAFRSENLNLAEISNEVLITDLKLSKKIINCLRDAEIKGLEDLKKRTSKQLLELKGIGEKSVREIENALKEYELAKDTAYVYNEKVTAIPALNVSCVSKRNVNNDDFIIEDKRLIRYIGKCEGEIVRIPNGIETIAADAFLGCSIRKVILPKGLTTIESNVFSGCDSLKEIDLPEGLLTIGLSAFQSSGIEYMKIPQSVKTIGKWAFLNCILLKKITLPVHLIPLAATFHVPTLCKVDCLCNTTGDFIIENQILIRYIGKCVGETVEVPNGIKQIGANAFSCCNIRKVILPKGLTTIGSDAFTACGSLKEIDLPDGLLTIGLSAFSFSGIEYMKIPQSVKTIGKMVFLGCRLLRKITLPEHLIPLANKFNIPPLCKVDCLCNTTGDFIIKNKKLIRYVGKCVGETVEVPNGIKQIAANAFSGCNIKKVILSKEITAIGTYAFIGCDSLKEIDLPEGLLTIGLSAFQSSGIEYMKIPQSVKTIGEHAFLSCRLLRKITLPEHLIPLAEKFAVPSLCKVECLCNTTGDFIIKNKKLIRYIGKCVGETVEVPNGIKQIAANAFSGCNIRKVILPKGLTTIGPNAFKNRSLLREIELPEGLKYIAGSAFENSGIEYMRIPQSVISIGWCAFSGCRLLKKITLPEHLMRSTKFFDVPISCEVESLGHKIRLY